MELPNTNCASRDTTAFHISVMVTGLVTVNGTTRRSWNLCLVPVSAGMVPVQDPFLVVSSTQSLSRTCQCMNAQATDRPWNRPRPLQLSEQLCMLWYFKRAESRTGPASLLGESLIGPERSSLEQIRNRGLDTGLDQTSEVVLGGEGSLFELRNLEEWR